MTPKDIQNYIYNLITDPNNRQIDDLNIDLVQAKDNTLIVTPYEGKQVVITFTEK